MSPGSRNAPIVAGFLRVAGFQLHSVVDERSAGFVALGMAIQLQKPVVLICTSGSAVVNYYSAVLEAFYQRIPLIVLTADRPEELIDNWDGQAIHQQNIFEPHTVGNFELPQCLDSQNCDAQIADVLIKANRAAVSAAQGPVQINVPLRDPIYENINAPIVPLKEIQPFNAEPLKGAIVDLEKLEINNGKVLFVAGQMPPQNTEIVELLTLTAEKWPMLCDITSNLSKIGVQNWELAFQQSKLSDIHKPDVLITFGLSVLSKKLKTFLRKHSPVKHYHICEGGHVGNPFFSNPETIILPLKEFLLTLLSKPILEENEGYRNSWNQFSNKIVSEKANNWEFQIVKTTMEWASENAVLHFSNSMPIRYAGLVGNTKATLHCNRGVSGIDGCTSTAVGAALSSPNNQHILISGDVSFFYDSNAFWQQVLPNNLTVILFNNNGGNIFEIIDGPSQFPNLLPYIKTPHKRTAKQICEDFGVEYLYIEPTAFNIELLNNHSNQCRVIEITTNSTENVAFWKNL